MELWFVFLCAGIAVGLCAGLFMGMRLREKSYEKQKDDSERFHQEAIRSLRNEFEKTIAGLNHQMQAVTEELLKRRQNEFSRTSEDKLNQLIQPLERTIKEMKERVAENTLTQTEIGGKLNAGLQTLYMQTTAARASAEKLANALKGSNQVQGLWGETVLKELLESQGLREGTHFDTQNVISDKPGKAKTVNSGGNLRPDLVLHLDKERDVIIDSKVSLSAYLDYVNATDEGTRKMALDKHIKSIENHVTELIRKDYSAYNNDGKTSMGFVIMFVPNAPALLLATSSKPDLWRKALEHKVYIADEKTLYAALKIIDLTWQQIAQANNHERVYELAREMLDRVGKFMESYTDIGNKLNAARESYEAGMKKLLNGGQSIPGTCRKLRELGASASRIPKGVPPELLGEG